MRVLIGNILLVAIMFCFSSCKHSTEPGESYKDPREMTWTYDTLYYPNSLQTKLHHFLAFNSNDIYAYGHCDDKRGACYKYDGLKWTPVESADRFFKMVPISRNNIYGFGGWVGDIGWQYHWDGFNWGRFNIPNLSEVIWDATINENKNIYACGEKGVVAKFNGLSWSKENINIPLPAKDNFVLSHIEYYNGKLFLNGDNSSYNGGWTYLIESDGFNYRLVDSTQWWPNKFTWGSDGFYKSPWGKLYSYGFGGIWVFNNGRWEPFYEAVNPYEDTVAMCGLSEDYYFIIKYPREVVFCRGKEQFSLNGKINLDLSNLSIGAIWTDGSEVFIACNTLGTWPERTIIIHGK